MLFDLSGKTALVTGAGQNIGAGIARLLASQGAAVAVNDLRMERAQETVKAIQKAGGKSYAVAFDVTDYAAVTAGVAEVVDALGPIDILVNNAGNGGAERMPVARVWESDPAKWDGPIRVNLYGVMHCTRAVINGMIERRWGRVITISSIAGTYGASIGVSPYAAGKGGGISFMRHLAIEAAPFGVTANTLALGLMGKGEPAPADVMPGLPGSPIGRLGSPDDIAAACVYLASNEASWVTAQTIGINGGAVVT